MKKQKYTLFEYKPDGELIETTRDPVDVIGIYARTISNAESNSDKSNDGGWWKGVLEDCVEWLRTNFKEDYFHVDEWMVLGLHRNDDTWPVVQRRPPVSTFGGFKKSEGF